GFKFWAGAGSQDGGWPSNLSPFPLGLGSLEDFPGEGLRQISKVFSSFHIGCRVKYSSTMEVSMNRRQFLGAAGMTALGIPFWAGLLPETLWGKLPSGIKITSLKTFVVHLGTVNWVFVKIYTNEGVAGLGEG